MSAGFSFDDSELDGETTAEALSQNETTAEEVVDSLEEDQRAQEEVDRAMSEVERRLALAECYKAVLQQRLFGQETQATVVVQKEMTAFCKRRLEVLMGIRKDEAVVQPPPPLPFSKDEIAALQALARTALSRMTLTGKTPAQPPAPVTIQPVPVPQAQPSVQVRPAPLVSQTAPKPPAAKPAVAKTTRPSSPRRKVRVIDDPRNPGKQIAIDLTRQVGQEGGNKNVVPMPDGAAMEAISQQQAVKALDTYTNKLPVSVQAGIAQRMHAKED